MFLHKKCVFPTCSLVIYITFGQKILQNVTFTVNLINFNIFMTTLNTSSHLKCTKIHWLFYYFKVIIDFKCNWVHRLIKWPCIALKNSSQLKANSINWEKNLWKVINSNNKFKKKQKNINFFFYKLSIYCSLIVVYKILYNGAIVVVIIW